MSASVVPALIDALVEQATTALDVNVFDGPTVTGDYGDYLMVGADDIEQDVNSATVSETPGPFGANRARDESGEVLLVAYSSNGDGDVKAARDAVYATAQAVADLCRSNPSLGVPGVLWTGHGSASSLRQLQDENGAGVVLQFSISFRARI